MACEVLSKDIQVDIFYRFFMPPIEQTGKEHEKMLKKGYDARKTQKLKRCVNEEKKFH